MLALDLAVLTGIFVLMGVIFQDRPTRMLMRYAGVLGIIIVLFVISKIALHSASLSGGSGNSTIIIPNTPA